ncbi:MOSC domain-containing protein [Vibrio tapetis]|uniref:Protein YiiM n=1 Tax=Vibrio tapetis subsp. tapetis TaxID=1671868 RepID=A0A2N8ZIJ1_9VIBR|nr:MOSC domain-containing protein [Vibrio tapetis]SON51720.1 Protein YiiM [Vibrio tapetis subsp. tapetis]
MTNRIYLNEIYRGKVQRNYGLETAIDKSPIEGEVFLSLLGLEGDQCADQKHHGGVERALHQYPVEHYAYWKEKYGDGMNWLAPGMGENMSSKGMTEDTVCIGDRYQWGEAVIEVSQPRSPCFKLNKRWGVEGLSVGMQDISRCGWLYRVITPGMVSNSAPLELVERPTNAMSVREVCDAFFGDPLNKDGLEKLKQQIRLSDSWMSKVMIRLETNEVENWNFRLLGHA